MATTQTRVVISRYQVSVPYFAEPLAPGVELQMIAIPAGQFWVGTPESQREEVLQEYLRYGTDKEDAERWLNYQMPYHQVQVSAFSLGRTPVTQAQWRVVATTLPQVNRELQTEPSNFKGDDLPVEQVSWHDATEFCDRLSRHTNRLYRVPSEAEWEYACRAGTRTAFHFGETITTDLVNCDGAQPYGAAPIGEYRKEPTPVGSFPSNGFGLYDMHGNVWEWCADPWHENYQGAPIYGSPWNLAGDVSKYVLRGGSWNFLPRHCRSANRDRNDADGRSSFVGFRLACSSVRTS